MDKTKLLNWFVQWLQLSGIAIMVYLGKMTFDDVREQRTVGIILNQEIKALRAENTGEHILMQYDIKELKSSARDIDHRTTVLEVKTLGK